MKDKNFNHIMDRLEHIYHIDDRGDLLDVLSSVIEYMYQSEIEELKTPSHVREFQLSNINIKVSYGQRFKTTKES
jgi:hypothetical protein